MAEKSQLSQEEMDDFRQKLMDKRRELEGDIEGLADDVQKSEPADDRAPAASPSDAPTHFADEASDERAEQKVKRLTEQERDTVMAIDEALRRIDEGTYGLCLMDKEPISKKRLEAKPWARYCLDHAESAGM